MQLLIIKDLVVVVLLTLMKAYPGGGRGDSFCFVFSTGTQCLRAIQARVWIFNDRFRV